MTDFKCTICKRELSAKPNSKKIWCKNCNKNFHVGNLDEWNDYLREWTFPGIKKEIWLQLSDLLNKKKMDHLVISALKKDGIYLKNYDLISKRTEPGKDYVDQDGNFYELISVKPLIFLNQTSFIQSKIIEKVDKYKKKEIDISNLTLIILDLSDPLGNSTQPIMYNQSNFATSVMSNFKKHYFIRPWYISDIYDWNNAENMEFWHKYHIPTKWIITSFSVMGHFNRINNFNRSINGANYFSFIEKWANLNSDKDEYMDIFRITDFFDIQENYIEEFQKKFKFFVIPKDSK